MLLAALSFSAGPMGAVGPEIMADVGLAATIEADWGVAFAKKADPDTSNASTIFSRTILENGRLWMDKSVNSGTANIYDTAGNRVDSVTAKANEFLITLSALAEAYSMDTLMEPLDAVFIVDVSGSMTYELNSEDDATSTTAMRAYAMAEALNLAVDMLMDANPENRVAVVAYGGESGRIPLAHDVLDLDRYSVPATEKYFNVTGLYPSAYFNVNSNISGTLGAIVPASIHINGGTPTQLGIHKGAQILMNNTQKTYTDPESGRTVARQPIMILLTDGEPTFGWTDYKTMIPIVNTTEFDWGDAIAADIGKDILTVATASYWKQMVSDHYSNNTISKKVDVEFYTIGMFINNTHSNAVLDPRTYANGNELNHSSVDYNMKELLDAFVADTSGVGAQIDFPALDGLYSTSQTSENQGYPRTITQIQNDGDYIKSYFYSDGYYLADNAGALESAFETITERYITMGGTITEIESGNPDYSGYLTFSDVIGPYMEVKSYEGLWFENQRYNGQHFAQEIAVQRLTKGVYWNNFIDSLATQMEVTDVEAEEVVENSFLGKSLYYTSPTDFGNQIRWYADNEKNYKGLYYASDGLSAAPVPAGAKCIMDLYPVEGVVSGSITGDVTDLTNVCLIVLTALESGSFNDDDDGAVLTRDLVKGEQIVRWYIPANLIPVRTVVETTGGDVAIKEAQPIRVVYSVGLSDDFDFATDVDAAYKAANRTPASGSPARYSFYTNQYRNDDNVAAVFGQISLMNPYYYYTNLNGKVPVYISDGSGGYVKAVEGDTGPFFAKDDYFDLNNANYLVDRFTPVDTSIVTIESGFAPYIESDTPRSENTEATFGKSNNTTNTRDYVAHIEDVITAPLAHPIQIRHLGNNGVFSIPVADVAVQKVWSGIQSEPIEVQLLANGVEVGSSVGLDEFNSWYTDWDELLAYNIKATAAGKAQLINYTVREIFLGDPPEGNSANYRQPVWNASTGTWTVAVITNRRYVPPTPTPPDGNPPVPFTGDDSPILLWSWLCAASVFGLGAMVALKRSVRGKKQV